MRSKTKAKKREQRRQAKEKRRQKRLAHREQRRRRLGDWGLERAFQRYCGSKMSDVLRAFVEPFAAEVASDDEYRALLRVGVIAWNTSLLKEEQREFTIDRLMQETMSTVAPGLREDLKAIFGQLIARKERLFHDDRRFIVDFQLTQKDDELHLVVVWTPADE